MSQEDDVPPFDVDPPTPLPVMPVSPAVVTPHQPYLVLEDVLVEAGRPAWDLLLIGDGSGTDWDHPAGWAVTSIDRLSGQRHVQLGSYSNATVNFVEAECYVHALRYDLYTRMNGKIRSPRKVVIFSDSQVTVNTGNGLYKQTYHPDVWLVYDYYRNLGYELKFFQLPRETNPLHSLMDKFSRSCRTTTLDTEGCIELVNTLLPRTNTNV